ncbi:MAG: hypothetical protein ACK5EW_01250 [Bacteroidota bacterium]|jgi:type VI protein secretion system component VasK
MIRIVILGLFLVLTQLAWSQNDIITPQNAEQRKKEQHDEIERKYLDATEKHQVNQGKKGKKAMRKHLRYSKRLRTGRNLPWYRRMFIRRK